jgi:DNA-binding NtrC family response regulator
MPVHIAVIGKHQEIKAVLMRLINQNKAFIGSVADSLEELEASGKINDVNLVLLSAGLSDEEEADIKRKIAANYPKIKVVPHYGGGSGLLMNEISEVLK